MGPTQSSISLNDGLQNVGVKSVGGCHSSKVLSAPTILRPRVESQAHQLSFFQLELLKLEWEMDENKRKRGRIGPIIFKIIGSAFSYLLPKDLQFTDFYQPDVEMRSVGTVFLR